MRGVLLALTLAVCAACASATPVTADRGQCFTEREFRVASTAPGIEIAGSIMAPAARPRGAVLMITGAGPHTREQRISNSPMFTMIAEHLVRRGMVVARTDARGFGGSTGPADDEAYTMADRAEDNRAVIAYLRGEPEFRRARFGLMGHSEGAMIAAMIAAGDRDLDFLVLLAPSTLKGEEVIPDQMETNLVRRGATPQVAAAVRHQAVRFFRFLGAGGERGDAFAAIAHDFLAAHGVAESENTPEFAQGLLSGFLDSPSSRYFVSYDPRADLERIRQPTVALFAERDANVRTERHRPAIEQAFQRSGAPLTAITLADQDHFFLEHNGARLDRHVPGEMEVADELYAALDAELARLRLTRSQACS